MNRVAVIGAGSWGTALAIHLARSGTPCVLWARGDRAADLQARRENVAYLPGQRLPKKLEVMGVVFSVRRGGRTNLTEWDIAVADLATGNHTVLLRGVRARYATSGHLLYVTADGTLMGVSFDETTLALTGDAVALVEDMRIGLRSRMGQIHY